MNPTFSLNHAMQRTASESATVFLAFLRRDLVFFRCMPMKLPCLCIMLLLPMCAQASDVRIDALIHQLSHSAYGTSGASPILHLPADAKVAQVLDRCFEMYSFAAGDHIKHFKILTTESVTIPPDTNQITAVLIDSDHGKKIVLMAYEHDDWWTRIYDTK